jgi:hypothetical protein
LFRLYNLKSPSGSMGFLCSFILLLPAVVYL